MSVQQEFQQIEAIWCRPSCYLKRVAYCYFLQTVFFEFTLMEKSNVVGILMSECWSCHHKVVNSKALELKTGPVSCNV